jgi:2-polyprenyl-6-methoxyphenol hydroxylase-like FAD-dependent oxidoreductase
MNLGWKLAQVVRGSAPESLLDTYAERHPIGARVLDLTLARTGDERTQALQSFRLPTTEHTR